MKNKHIIYFVLLFVLLIACSDNNTNPIEEFDYNEYLPLDTGNYWYYNYYLIDKSGNHDINPYAYDSTFVVDSSIIQNRNAINLMKNLNETGKLTDQQFSFSTDSNQIAIYGLKLQLNDTVSMDVDYWVPIYNRFKSPWEVNDIVLNDTVINGATFNGIIRFDGYFVANTKIEISGELYKTFITKLKIDYELSQKVDTLEIDLSHTIEYEYRFAKNIGLVVESYKTLKDSTLLSGYEKIITNYKK